MGLAILTLILMFLASLAMGLGVTIEDIIMKEDGA